MPLGQKVRNAPTRGRSRVHAAAIPAASQAATPAFHTRRGWLAVVAVGLLALVAAGCSKRAVPLEDAPLPFRQAEDNFRLGNYEKAVRGYQVFLDSEASEEYDELVPRAYYRMAMAEYRRGRYSECLAVLDRMERRAARQAVAAGVHAARRRRAGARQSDQRAALVGRGVEGRRRRGKARSPRAHRRSARSHGPERAGARPHRAHGTRDAHAWSTRA